MIHNSCSRKTLLVPLNKLPFKQPVLSYLEPYTKDIFKKETTIDSVHWVCSYPWKVWNTIASGSTRVMQVRKNFSVVFSNMYLSISYGSIRPGFNSTFELFFKCICSRSWTKNLFSLDFIELVDLWNLTFCDQSAHVEIPSLCVHI